MNYCYKGTQDSGEFVLTDLSTDLFEASHQTGDYYKIIWAKDEDIQVGVDGYRINLKKDHLLFCTPLNQLEIDSSYMLAVSYVFNRDFYCIRDHDNEVSCNGFLFLGSSTPIVVGLSKGEQKSFDLLYMFFIEEFNTKDDIQGEMLLVLLKRLLIKSVRIARKILPNPDMPKVKLDVIRQFNLLVEMHFREKHKVSQYASLLNLSPKSLSNLLLKYNHKSPLKVIAERICLEGQRLLRFSLKHPSEISEELGFIEGSHFSKFFKKHTGMSPTAYRNKFK